MIREQWDSCPRMCKKCKHTGVCNKEKIVRVVGAFRWVLATISLLIAFGAGMFLVAEVENITAVQVAIKAASLCIGAAFIILWALIIPKNWGEENA